MECRTTFFFTGVFGWQGRLGRATRLTRLAARAAARAPAGRSRVCLHELPRFLQRGGSVSSGHLGRLVLLIARPLDLPTSSDSFRITLPLQALKLSGKHKSENMIQQWNVWEL